MLERRDPNIYGGISLNDLETQIYAWAREFVDWCHDALDWADGVIVNPGAWSHYSYAIRDALELLTVPVVEVHLSNIEEREEWRPHSVIAELAATPVLGRGPDGYREALRFLCDSR